jgi:hypothetical protein
MYVASHYSIVRLKTMSLRKSRLFHSNVYLQLKKLWLPVEILGRLVHTEVKKAWHGIVTAPGGIKSHAANENQSI